MQLTAEKIIQKLKLLPHPEGGYFREIYRSKGIIKEKHSGETFIGDRNYSTSIYFLLTSENFSAFHRINQDEIWHFYTGSPLNIHIIDEEGKYSKNRLGIDFEKGEVPQFVIHGGSWFAANVIDPESYTLIGCTVAPGFDYRDFELANRNALIKRYPKLCKVITKFTRSS